MLSLQVVKFRFTTHASPYTRPGFDSGFFSQMQISENFNMQRMDENFQKIEKNKNKNNVEAAHVLW